MKEMTALIRNGYRVRRYTATVFLAIILILSAGIASVYAAPSDGFQLVKTTPEDGYSRVQAQNVMVKLYFNDDVDNVSEMNQDKFLFTDNKGKNVKFKIYYDKSQKNMIALLSTKDLKVDKKYKITVDGALVNNDGTELGKTETISFTTKQSGGGLVYGLLMVAMIVVMVIFTVRDQRRKAVEEEAAEGKPTQAKQRNPYKLAKEKGISVEEATRIINKEKAKEQKKINKQLEKQKRREEKLEKQLEEEFEEYQIFRVHTKRVVKRGGSGAGK